MIALIVAREPFLRLPLSSPAEALGRALVEVLNAFGPCIDLGWKERSAHWKKLLQSVGIRSGRQLQQRAVCCSVSRDAQGIMIRPSRNGGTAGNRSGFSQNGTAFTILPGSSPAEIGEALIKGFALCTSIYNQDPKTKNEFCK